METKNVEVTQFKKADSDIPSDKVGELESTPPKEGEVGGRSHYTRIGQCPNCGYIGYYRYDTNRWHAYRCASCGSVLVG